LPNSLAPIPVQELSVSTMSTTRITNNTFMGTILVPDGKRMHRTLRTWGLSTLPLRRMVSLIHSRHMESHTATRRSGTQSSWLWEMLVIDCWIRGWFSRRRASHVLTLPLRLALAWLLLLSHPSSQVFQANHHITHPRSRASSLRLHLPFLACHQVTHL
jgi:hypothetical protein